MSSIGCTLRSIQQQTNCSIQYLNHTNTVIAQKFLAEVDEKHDVSESVFLVDDSHSLQAACHREGHDFRYEKHGNRNAVERVFCGIKRRTICFSNTFSNASAETVDDWISFAWNQLYTPPVQHSVH
jgi:transposase-like protein